MYRLKIFSVKVIHIELGLGNQMLSYCELLVMQKIHPGEQYYIENIIYDIPEVNNYICKWNISRKEKTPLIYRIKQIGLYANV